MSLNALHASFCFAHFSCCIFNTKVSKKTNFLANLSYIVYKKQERLQQLQWWGCITKFSNYLNWNLVFQLKRNQKNHGVISVADSYIYTEIYKMLRKKEGNSRSLWCLSNDLTYFGMSTSFMAENKFFCVMHLCVLCQSKNKVWVRITIVNAKLIIMILRNIGFILGIIFRPKSFFSTT